MNARSVVRTAPEVLTLCLKVIFLTSVRSTPLNSSNGIRTVLSTSFGIPLPIDGWANRASLHALALIAFLAPPRP